MNYLFNLASLFGLTFRVLTIALVSVFGAANVAGQSVSTSQLMSLELKILSVQIVFLSSHLPFNFSKQ